MSLYAAVLVRYVICKAAVIYDTDISEWFSKENFTFTSEMNHKPYCNEIPDLDFSFSHTKNAILCAVTSEGKIGADLEPVRKAPMDILKIVFHENEKDYITSGEGDSDYRFFRITHAH